MKNTVKLSDIGARTRTRTTVLLPFFKKKKKKTERKKNAAVFIARREFSPTRRRVQHGIKLFRIKCVVENRKRLTLK